jgi:hypothetical protein
MTSLKKKCVELQQKYFQASTIFFSQRSSVWSTERRRAESVISLPSLKIRMCCGISYEFDKKICNYRNSVVLSSTVSLLYHALTESADTKKTFFLSKPCELSCTCHMHCRKQSLHNIICTSRIPCLREHHPTLPELAPSIDFFRPCLQQIPPPPELDSNILQSYRA